MTYLDTRDLDAELNSLEDADELDSAEIERRDVLRELRGMVGDEWPYGALLIPEDEFEDYARELADDIGAVDLNAGWPTRCIDWKQAARELAMDYGSVTFEGTDYLFRG